MVCKVNAHNNNLTKVELEIYNFLKSLEVNGITKIGYGQNKESQNILNKSKERLRQITNSLEAKGAITILSRRKYISMEKGSPEYRFAIHLSSTYNISYEEYEQMRSSQDYRCAICQKPESETGKGKLDIDHCHKTGKIRGLLCRSCNTALGKFGEKIENFMRAIDYIQRH